MQQPYISYLIEWLIDDPLLAQQVVYSDNQNEWQGKRLVIRPSNFFDDGVFLTEKTRVDKITQFLPSRGLIDGMEDEKFIPVLFGTNSVTEKDGQIILDADLIASTFYFVTRYEELINSVRDEHGRFPASESLLMRSGMMHYPIVDEYSDYLRNLLGAKPRQRGLRNIYLTHDVDTIAFYRHLRGFVGGLSRRQFRAALDAQKDLTKDAAYTFPWMIEQDNKVKKAQQIYFLKAAESQIGYDYPVYNLMGADAQQLLLQLADNKVQIGLHCSYASGNDSSLIIKEKERLQHALNKSVTLTRYHYLRSCSPDDFQVLSDIGITDDFTMGFAQLAGFRLATSRPIRWINPKTRIVSNLTLHPLAAMDCSLTDYMKLDTDDSFRYVKDLIDQAEYHGGELSLLWHNSIFAQQPDHQQLYSRIIDYLLTK